MLLFPNAKVNIGLNILRRRADGYHDISTVMVPVPWTDVLEMVPAKDGLGSFNIVGTDTLGLVDKGDNLVMKALRALERYIGRPLPPTDIYLSKIIPTGAGLGGGSSDASFAISGANELYGLGLSKDEMAAVAAGVGADCPFFIYNSPMLAEGIGERLSPLSIPALDGVWIVIAKPVAEAVSTKEAYAGVNPSEWPGRCPMADAVAAPVSSWMGSDVLVNDFEQSIFALRPSIADVKRRMLTTSALYVSMSGSGASVFGLFDSDKLAETAVALFNDCETFAGKLSSVSLSER